METKFQILKPVTDKHYDPSLINTLYDKHRIEIESKLEKKKRKEQRKKKKSVSKPKPKNHESNWLKLRKQLIGKSLKRKQKKLGDGIELEVTELEVKKENIIEELKKRFGTKNKVEHTTKVGDFLSLSCGTVLIGKTKESIARISMVDNNGNIIYDTYVLPGNKVLDYRTKLYGFTSENFNEAKPFSVVREEVQAIINGKSLVGVDVKKSLELLNITIPYENIYEILTFKPLLKANCGRKLTLKKLAKHLLGLWIQAERIDTLEDAYAAISIFLLVKKIISKPSSIKLEEKVAQNNKANKGKQNQSNPNLVNSGKGVKQNNHINLEFNQQAHNYNESPQNHHNNSYKGPHGQNSAEFNHNQNMNYNNAPGNNYNDDMSGNYNRNSNYILNNCNNKYNDNRNNFHHNQQYNNNMTNESRNNFQQDHYNNFGNNINAPKVNQVIQLQDNDTSVIKKQKRRKSLKNKSIEENTIQYNQQNTSNMSDDNSNNLQYNQPSNNSMSSNDGNNSQQGQYTNFEDNMNVSNINQVIHLHDNNTPVAKKRHGRPPKNK